MGATIGAIISVCAALLSGFTRSGEVKGETASGKAGVVVAAKQGSGHDASRARETI